MNPHEETAGIEELLSRARSGDRAAEERLFGRLDARIASLAKRRVRDEEAARDIAQETMQTVFEKYADAHLPRGLLPWVFTILHHKVGNYLKRRRVETKHMAGGDTERIWGSVGVSPDGVIGAIDLGLALERAFRKATAECRKIFRLLLEGARRSEIQDAFPGEPMGTVDSRISRCRKKLLQRLEAMDSSGGRRR